MIQNKIFIICILFTTTILAANKKVSETPDSTSFKDQISTDRPHQTETANIIPKGYVQIENGVTYEVENTSDNGNVNFSYSNFLLKYGIGNGIDLRLGLDYTNTKNFKKGLLKRNYSELSDVTVGFKKNLIESNSKWVPKITLMAEMTLPYFQMSTTKRNPVGGTFVFLCEHEIVDGIEFEYNVGPEWGTSATSVSFFYATSLTVKIIGPLSIYIESYGHFIDNMKSNFAFQNDIRFDGGFVVLLNNNLQFDIEAGKGYSDISPNYFVSSGLSWRLKVK